ncbi:(2Fe-2S)-binding protein [Streptomyces sp. NBC_01221]|uniref:(2Fe-2S)-binding protein n=1 Tax=unclassified Streptomyces TaxID=2593676 RepID=UPI00224CE674|nr:MULTISPECIES: (2Fe-2S)-binding protein [unclassified Streptomyces]WSP59273.1 (2Fe-2S)-binding protein [Streptomyces sp. NBC_01241]WSU20206.1 (2Fe-2S)-binding protein [Streptomyces sp. NBC_01108]MCX4791024.1 (2Fe-2S)-binding protein [Streptomyces sp. NBC_01221]MCX4793251.1 (2Fe-2S)-binding protein [Streptomyces sp. NBC_01242]WSJ34692.1 (2Fe-2S)-binding protein [Streptomyces sp. NBC_01321]
MDEPAGPFVGGFFALRTTAPPEGAYRPLALLYAGESAPLTARIDTVADRLRTSERRVAASVAHLGLAARLWSVALGPAALTGRLPGLSPDALYWGPGHTAPDDLWLSTSDTLPATADRIREVVQFGHLVPLAEAIHRDGSLSNRLLWGNAGSALAGALRELVAWARSHGRPDVSARARALVAELFDHPDLRNTGAPHDTAFRRRSCCLYYRCPAGGLCGDCVFESV